ncbi:MAG: type II toxin-antitoxin system VapC family toxin [Candidatus Dadabacteria bacterium]|nr:type II toxin-antitoxin system VapC family toxin [Candidatus Dadabacteria bacterium]
MPASYPADISKYSFSSKDKLFFDTNIWLFTHGINRPNDPKEKAYSNALSQIIKAKSRIYTDVLVVSEFVNTCAKREFSIRNQGGGKLSFKRFRNSERFKSISSDVTRESGKILKLCDRLESGFRTLNMQQVLDDYEEGRIDFNDLVISDICKRNKLILVTDDGDFRNEGIPILTANRKMLNGRGKKLN